MALEDIPRFARHNLRTLRHAPLSEISGALGDLGTLLPLMIALALQGSISLPSTLVFSGLFNIATGVAFGLPLPVQPMKAIAAASLASHASQRDTLAAGALVGAAVLVLAATGLLRRLAAWTPVPVVRGIQLGAGLSLVVSAGSGMLARLAWCDGPLDNRLWALAAFLLLVLTARAPRFPYALVVSATGLALALAAAPRLPRWHVWRPRPAAPALASPAAWSMAVAQLPLTTLNSAVAAAALAAELMGPPFPGPAPSVTQLGVSVAAMNLAGCWFGAMPVCHGAGGLAAQHRFGARSGASIMLLGSLKLALGLLLGPTLLDLLGSFPRSILGVMVAAAGLELARVGQSLNHGAPDLWEDSIPAGDGLARAAKRHRDISDDERHERWTVMLVTAAGILAFRNDAVGFVAGVLTHLAYHLSHALERRRASAGERQPLLRWP